MRRTLNHISSYFIWRMRCSIIYSDEVATPPVIAANRVWKEFKTTLKARIKHTSTKEKRWALTRYGQETPPRPMPTRQ